MTTLRPLAFKVIRGAGRLDLVRLLLLVGGIALCVISLIFAALLPGVFDSQRDRQAARTAQVAFDPPNEAELTHMVPTQELYGSRQLTRFLVSNVVDGSRPPGVTDLPAPGHLLVSPALAQALAVDPTLRERFVGTVDGVIGDEGLVAPDELFAYVGVDGVIGKPVARFGVSAGSIWNNGDGPTLAIELLVLLGLPALGFLVVSFRLSMASRMARLRALRLVGLTAADCARIFAWELAATAVVGALLAVLLYNPIQGAFGQSTATGFSWFGSDGELPIIGMVIVWSLAVGAAYAVGYRTALRQLRTTVPASENTESLGGRVARRILAGAGLAASGLIGWMLISLPGKNAEISSTVILTIYLSTVVLTIVGLVFTPRVAAGLAATASEASFPASARLGFRLARHHTSGAFLTVVAVAMLVLVSGLSSAFIQSLIATTQGDGNSVVVDVALDDLPRVERRAVMNETRNTAGYVNVDARSSEKNAFGDDVASIYVGDCSAVAIVHSVPLSECNGHESGRLDFATALGGDGLSTTLEAGTTLLVDMSDGTHARVEAPEATIESDALVTYFGMILPNSEAPWIADVATATVHFSVGSNNPSYERLLTALAQTAPHSAPLTQFKDNDSFLLFGHQKGILDFGVIGGLVLAIFALCVSGFSQRMDQRRSTAALRMLGVSAGTIRVASVVQKAFPVLLAVTYFSAISIALGVAFLYATNTDTDVVGPIVARVLLAALAAVVASVLVGVFTLGGNRLSVQDARE